MAKTCIILCFTAFVFSGTLLDVVSPTFLPSVIPKIAEPKTVKDVEPYTVKVVMTFVFDLEKECPKTREFKELFERLKAFSKYVCPISQVMRSKDSNAYESDMKAKAGSLFQSISSFATSKSESREVMMTLKSEQREAMDIVGSFPSIARKFMSRRNRFESDDSMELTAEQRQVIKDRIIKWQQVITRVVKTMVQSSKQSSTRTRTEESSQSSSMSSNGGRGVTVSTGEAYYRLGNGESEKSQTTETPRGSGDNKKKGSANANSGKNASVEFNGGIRGSATEAQGGNGSSKDGTTSKNKGSNVNSTVDTNAANIGISTLETTIGGNKDSEKDKKRDNKGGAQGSENGDTTVDTAKGGNKDSEKDKKKDNKEGNGATSHGGTSVDKKGSNANSTTDIKTGDSTKSTIDTKGSSESFTSGSASKSRSIDASTTEEVMGFIINLEKKCPKTEEFKSFFEKLKAFMKYACPINSMVGKKNPRSYMSEMISIGSKLSDAMALVQSRMSKSRETKSTMQNYQQEMMKALQVLQEVTSNVVKENQSKQDGSVTVTQTQQKVIKETITKWEQVTTQFVETAVESETRSSSRTEYSSSQQSSAASWKTKSFEGNGRSIITH